MMPTATYNFREGYRYGFNGQEKDDNIKGAGNSYDFGGRSIYDGRLGRFISVDEYAKVVPNKSPYGYAGNNPIKFIDKDGGFQLPAEDKANYPVLDNILQNLYQFATENPNVIESFIKNSGLDATSNSISAPLFFNSSETAFLTFTEVPTGTVLLVTITM